jgi:hypothetical protein
MTSETLIAREIFVEEDANEHRNGADERPRRAILWRKWRELQAMKKARERRKATKKR